MMPTNVYIVSYFTNEKDMFFDINEEKIRFDLCLNEKFHYK